MNAFELTGIRKTLGEFTLSIDSLSIEQGKTYAIVGSNGSGKTTLLNLLAHIENPDEGTISVSGGQGDSRSIAYLMQNPYLFRMNVRSNIELGMKLRGVDSKTRAVRARELMDQLRLAQLAERPLHTLSGGESQRTAIARTLAMDSPILLLDEPVAGVDRANVRAVEKIIRKLSEEDGRTVVISTHSQDQAVRLAEDVITVVDGRITDIAHENVFAGTLRTGEDGVKLVDVGGDIELRTSHGEPGEVTVAVDPVDIILSEEMIESSALNAFKGRVTRIEEARDSLQVYIDIGVPLCTRITHKSLKALGIAVGGEMWVTFKATAVRIL